MLDGTRCAERELEETLRIARGLSEEFGGIRRGRSLDNTKTGCANALHFCIIEIRIIEIRHHDHIWSHKRLERPSPLRRETPYQELSAGERMDLSRFLEES
jgi:hypothetical protein